MLDFELTRTQVAELLGLESTQLNAWDKMGYLNWRETAERGTRVRVWRRYTLPKIFRVAAFKRLHDLGVPASTGLKFADKAEGVFYQVASHNGGGVALENRVIGLMYHGIYPGTSDRKAGLAPQEARVFEIRMCDILSQEGRKIIDPRTTSKAHIYLDLVRLWGDVANLLLYDNDGQGYLTDDDFEEI